MEHMKAEALMAKGIAGGNQESCAPSPPPPIPEQRRSQETAPAKKPSSRARFRKQSRASSSLETFWTGCDSCRIKYEFEKKFVGQTLRCHRCQQPFLALEMPAPPSKRKQEDPIVASGGPTNMPPENVGTASAKSAPCGGLDREKPRKRRPKETGQQTISKHQSRVFLMGWAKQNTLNHLNKWNKVG